MQIEAVSVDEVITRHRAIREPRAVSYAGHEFLEHPGVFSPFIAPSGCLEFAFASGTWIRGRSILDIGSGSGVPTCLFALNGATRVVGVDINPSAVRAGRANACRLSLQDRVSFLEGDVFGPVGIEDEFDLVFADLPFMTGTPTSMLERAFYDPGLRSVKAYIDEIGNRFRRRHKIEAYVCVSDLDEDSLADYATNRGLKWSERMVVILPWVRLSLVQLL